MEQDDDGRSPLEQFQEGEAGLLGQARLDWNGIEQSRQRGITRFTDALAQFVAILEKQIPQGVNVLFVHTMAGGIPRARVYMPLFNRVFKGQGERYSPRRLFGTRNWGNCVRSVSTR